MTRESSHLLLNDLNVFNANRIRPLHNIRKDL